MTHAPCQEHMITIPHRLMMSEFHAKADPDLGHVHRENEQLLKNDNGLALYIMQETLKGEASFYWPYLQVLPMSRNIKHWSEPNLANLQDDKLVRKSAARSRHIHALYRDTIGLLSRSYPGLYPVRVITYIASHIVVQHYSYLHACVCMVTWICTYHESRVQQQTAVLTIHS